MSLLISSDWHAHNWPRQSTTLANGMNSRLADLLDVIRQIGDYANEYDVTEILMLGDWTHRRGFVTYSVLSPLMAATKSLTRSGHMVHPDRRLIALVGNHDIESVGYHALEPLRYIDGIMVVDAPTWIEISVYGSAFFCPYMSGDAVTQACRDQQCQRPAFLHYALDGHVVTNEHAVPSPLRLDDLGRFDPVFFGHIHTPTIESNGRVLYVGATMHMDFGDDGGRFCWYVSDDGSRRALPLRAPQFVSTTYPRISEPPECGGFLRVLCTPPADAEDVKHEARELGWRDVTTLPPQSIPIEAARVLTQNLLADEQAIRAYVARQYAMLDDAERDFIVDFGISCLRET